MNLKLQTAYRHQPEAQGSVHPWFKTGPHLPPDYSPHRSPLQFTDYSTPSPRNHLTSSSPPETALLLMEYSTPSDYCSPTGVQPLNSLGSEFSVIFTPISKCLVKSQSLKKCQPAVAEKWALNFGNGGPTREIACFNSIYAKKDRNGPPVPTKSLLCEFQVECTC